MAVKTKEQRAYARRLAALRAAAGSLSIGGVNKALFAERDADRVVPASAQGAPAKKVSAASEKGSAKVATVQSNKKAARGKRAGAAHGRSR